MWSRLVLVSVASACSFHHGDAKSDGSVGQIDGSIDGPIDGMSDARIWPGCFGAWHDHTVSLMTAVPVAGQGGANAINTTGYERDPWLTPDEKSIYFSAIRAGSMPMNQSDIYKATRTAKDQPFGNATRDTTISSTDGSETKTSRTADDRYIVIGSTRGGGQGDVDVWEATRANTAANFGTAEQTHLAMVNTNQADQDPQISADGLHLYLAPYVASDGHQHLVIASRPTITSDFSAPVELTPLRSGMGEGDPAITSDELIILFTSGRTASPAFGNIWYATRDSIGQDFGAPQLVPNINSDANEGDPHLSDDGCTLYFGSDRNSTFSNPFDWDIFVAQVSP